MFSSRLRILEGGCLDEDEGRESWGLRGMGGVLGLDVVEGVGLGNVLLIVLSAWYYLVDAANKPVDRGLTCCIW